MEDKNELNDIILNKGDSASSNKKIVLAVATLGVILVVVVMLMNSLSSNGTDNLPQAALPPEPYAKSNSIGADEPLFEDIEIIEEVSNKEEENLDKIAKRLKKESNKEVIKPQKKIVKVAKIEKPKKVYKKPKKTLVAKNRKTGKFYVQVGSFSKYKPDKKFLKSITNLNFKYRFHKVTKNSQTLNKVLVGPFKTKQKARNSIRLIRAKVEPGAFITSI